MEKFITERHSTDGLVADALRTVRVAAVWGWEKLVEIVRGAERGDGAAEVVAEAEVMPAVLSSIGGPATLRELGVPGSLAAEFEVLFDLMGRSRPDGHVAGYHFRTADGVCHALRSSSVNAAGRKIVRAA